MDSGQACADPGCGARWRYGAAGSRSACSLRGSFLRWHDCRGCGARWVRKDLVRGFQSGAEIFRSGRGQPIRLTLKVHARAEKNLLTLRGTGVTQRFTEECPLAAQFRQGFAGFAVVGTELQSALE